MRVSAILWFSDKSEDGWVQAEVEKIITYHEGVEITHYEYPGYNLMREIRNDNVLRFSAVRVDQ